ncbi:MAG TPA: amidase family protein, partial [Limnobacter sp.]|nr:amidase family protein [Limnobacter sp.]
MRWSVCCVAASVALSGCLGNSGEVASTSPRLGTSQNANPASGEFNLLEATIADVHKAFAGVLVQEDGTALTCVELANLYVERIAALDTAVIPQAGGLPLNAMVSINPLLQEQAQALDDAYAAKGLSGPLHCVPVILKDLYDTKEFPTTAASATLAGSQPPDDAFTVKRMREHGALILGKASMTEFAYFTQSYNSQTLRIGTPYDTSRDAGGSSGGTGAAIAANFGLVGTGSDTCASVRLPPSNNALVGVRSTVGLVSQDGLVPLSHSLDVGGPMTRTVRDAALLLDAMAGRDPADAKTLDSSRVQPDTYTAFLDPSALKGKRLGVLRSYGGTDAIGSDPAVVATFNQALTDLKSAGATLVDPIDFPQFESLSLTLIPREFADHLDEYLASFNAPHPDTRAVFLSGRAHPVIQALIGASLALRDTESASYQQVLAKRNALRSDVEAFMDANKLDALVYPPVLRPAMETGIVQGDNCEFGSTTGLPSIVVPAGFSSDSRPRPVGIEFLGRRWDEGRLFGLAYAYEQFTNHRKPPEF